MAQLILTPEEEANPRWLSLDPETLGKTVLAGASTIADFYNKDAAITKGYSALFFLLWEMREANAAELKLTLEGVTQGGKDLGSFELVLRQKAA